MTQIWWITNLCSSGVFLFQVSLSAYFRSIIAKVVRCFSYHIILWFKYTQSQLKEGKLGALNTNLEKLHNAWTSFALACPLYWIWILFFQASHINPALSYGNLYRNYNKQDLIECGCLMWSGGIIFFTGAGSDSLPVFSTNFFLISIVKH